MWGERPPTRLLRGVSNAREIDAQRARIELQWRSETTTQRNSAARRTIRRYPLCGVPPQRPG